MERVVVFFGFFIGFLSDSLLAHRIGVSVDAVIVDFLFGFVVHSGFDDDE